MYEHGNIVFASETWGAHLGIGPRSRIVQWCAFTFGRVITSCFGCVHHTDMTCAADVSLVETIVALMRGACICMPTEEERTHNIEAFVTRVGADWAFFTPSVARTLEPSQMPGLKTVVLGGEATSREIVARWAPNRRLINSYGPCECTVCLLYTSPSPRDGLLSRMPSSA